MASLSSLLGNKFFYFIKHIFYFPEYVQSILFAVCKMLFRRPSVHPDFMLMLVLIKFVYQFHASFYIRVVLTAIYKFPFYMLQARDACDMGISIAFEFPVR